jgi:alpha-amylase
MSEHTSGGTIRGALTRRKVLKGAGATAAAAAAGTTFTGSAAAAGEPVALQYFDYGDYGPVGGHWNRVASEADAISNVGYDAVWVQQPCQPASTNSNGYNPKNHRNFDQTSFGDEAEFSSMTSSLHNASGGYVKLYVDTVLNHMGTNDPSTGAYPYFSRRDFHDPQSVGEDRLDGQLAGLWDLDQDSGYVRGELYNYVKKISDLGADGYRWDAAKHIPQWFWRDEANRWANDLNMFRVGEVFDGNTDFLMNYTDQYVNGEYRGQNVFDYPLFYTLQSNFGYGGDLSQVRAKIENDNCVVGRNPLRACPFVENHDVDAPGNKGLAEAFITTIPGYPFLYDNHAKPEGSAFDGGDRNNLVWIANNLAGGELYFRYDDANNLIYERYNNLLMGINQSGSQTQQWVYTSWRNQNLNDYSGNNGAYVNGDGWVQVTIPAGDYVALAP